MLIPHQSHATLEPKCIATLPPEVLGEILVSCVSSANAIATRPMDLASVCKSWHDVVLGTPQIWTRLHLHASLSTSTQEYRITNTFSRSGSCGVDVVVDDVSSVSAAIARLLSAYASRIVSLTLRSPSEAAYHLFLSKIYSHEANKDRLRRLHIRQPSMPDAATTAEYEVLEFPQLMMLDVPEWRYTKWLCSPSISSDAPSTIMQSSSLDAHVLKSTLQNISILEPLSAPPLFAFSLLSFLQHHERLTHLEVKCRIAALSIPPPSAQEIVSLPTLTHLRLTTNDVYSIMSKLSLPTLKVLEIIDLDGCTAERTRSTGTALLALFSRGALPPIRHLRLVGVNLSSAAICFARLGRVEKLILERCFDVDSVLETIATSAGPGMVFSNLKALEVSGSGEYRNIVDSIRRTRKEMKVVVVEEDTITGCVEESVRKLEEMDLFSPPPKSPPHPAKVTLPIVGVRRGFGFGVLPKKRPDDVAVNLSRVRPLVI